MSPRKPLEPVAPPKTKKCTKCKVTKPIEDFVKDTSKPSGYTARCKACGNKYNKSYYAANAEELIQAELDRRKGKTPEKGERIHSLTLSVKFDPAEMRLVIAAYIKEFGVRPNEQQLQEWLTRYAKAGVAGQAKYILEKKTTTPHA
jgi:hypothetical protein